METATCTMVKYTCYDSHYPSYFSVYGCSDVDVPEGAWYTRDGESAIIGCEKEDLVWTLHCEGTEWKGTVGSCAMQSECAVTYNALMYS